MRKDNRCIRVDEEVWGEWCRKAEEARMTVSAWLRVKASSEDQVCPSCGGSGRVRGGPVNVIQSARIEGLSEPPKAPRPPVPKLPGLVRGSDIPSPKQSFVVGTDRLGKPEMVPAREDQVAPVREPQSQCINCNHFEGDRTGDPITLGDKYGWLCKECR